MGDSTKYPSEYLTILAPITAYAYSSIWLAGLMLGRSGNSRRMTVVKACKLQDAFKGGLEMESGK